MVADQVMQIINEIALKLGVAAEMVYLMLVKQAGVFCGIYRIGMWIFGISAIFAVTFGIVCAVRYVVVHAYEDRVKEVCMIIARILGIIAFIAGFVLLLFISEYVTAMHNPDMWAIQYVLKLMGVG